MRNHCYVERVSLRRIRNAATAGRDREIAESSCAQGGSAEHRAKAASGPRVRDAARRDRHETKSSRRRRGHRIAIAELGAGNTCVPVENTGGLHIFTGIPEGAIVSRINLHGAIVAPAGKISSSREVGLRACTRYYNGFGLHSARRITSQAAGNGDGRGNSAAGNTV